MITLSCPKHKKYQAILEPRVPCWYCRELYAIKTQFRRNQEKYGMEATNLDALPYTVERAVVKRDRLSW